MTPLVLLPLLCLDLFEIGGAPTDFETTQNMFKCAIFGLLCPLYANARKLCVCFDTACCVIMRFQGRRLTYFVEPGSALWLIIVQFCFLLLCHYFYTTGPISVLETTCRISFVGKLMERVITRRLSWFVETNAFSPSQRGYHQQHSTEDQLALLTQDIENSKRSKKILTVFFDMSKAFKRVWKKDCSGNC